MTDLTNQVPDTIDSLVKRRRSLIPMWIKVFCWIFMIMGLLAPLGFIVRAAGYPFQLALYGIETNDPFSLVGVGLIFVFVFKGFCALMLWLEKDNAVLFAQIDAILGIVICIFVMLVYPFIDNNSGIVISIRLELALLIPYLIRIGRMKKAWKQS